MHLPVSLIGVKLSTYPREKTRPVSPGIATAIYSLRPCTFDACGILPGTEDDEIINQRIAGSRVRAIAKASGTSVAEVNRVIDRWVETSVSPELRKQTLALELAGLDQLQLMFYRRAMEGDVQSGALVAKLIERRFVMLAEADVQDRGGTQMRCSPIRRARRMTIPLPIRHRWKRPPRPWQGHWCVFGCGSPPTTCGIPKRRAR